ncbi:prephenate dehydratase [Zhaonella formicivorans]|jgi:prephenate dehydratase|uniref:prephenate dehydratase n=1 Tax=Zhaonella formicivorans TaxID=2528593 RepID=UPI001D128A66|nr:prephenate dehydratase [Zhaonella formicivorans]
MSIKVGYLGPEGTFTEQAAKKWADQSLEKPAQLFPVSNIPQLVHNVCDGEFVYGVLPVENSIEGTVNLTVDTLIKAKAVIIGEVITEIEHCLVLKKGASHKIQVVFSHPQALAQCYDYLSREFAGVNLVQVASTAEAARMVAEGPPGWAAVCSKHAAMSYGLDILAAGIQDYLENKTRFLVIGKNIAPPSGFDKTSLVIALPQNRPGGLYRVLKEFADAEINLTKIESRPTKKELGEYLFWIDCEGHIEDDKLKKVLKQLSTQAALLTILGSYPRAHGGAKL